MLKALLWKEWHEQRGRMALATVWLLGMTAIGLKTRILPDETILRMIWIPTAIVLPSLIGMGLFAAERRAETLTYLMARPASRERILTAKLIVGALAYIAPLVLCGTGACLTIGGRELATAPLIGLTGAVIAFGLILLAWQVLAGLQCRREETYVLVSGAVLCCWVMHAYAVDELTRRSEVESWMLLPNPLALLRLTGMPYRPGHEVWTTILAQCLIFVGLSVGLWFRVRRPGEGRS